ncbi:hypothetical protein EII25_01730 [Erysipelotrichaceae bacterium OH741_COT-311]|nr:hypothetical protein EII25_01730 [Erysipelotrichaceae bacterium OH741_COT-311]
METILFLLFVFLKQFYIYTPYSKLISVADLFLALSFLCTLYKMIKNKELFKSLIKDYLYYVFILIGSIINLIYFLIYKQPEFITCTLFLIYVAMTVMTFRHLLNKDDKIKKYLSYILIISILLQFVIYLTNSGNVFLEHWGAYRYIGTFKDPNQFGFYLYSSCIIILMIHSYKFKWWLPIIYLVSFYLILQSKSTSSFIGMISLTIFLFLYFIYQTFKYYHVSIKWFYISLIAVIMGIVITLYLIWPSANFDIKKLDYTILTRIQYKLKNITDGGIKSLFYERGAQKLYDYPYYIFFGSGEGYYARFNELLLGSEIHSTLPNYLFAYGIVPFYLLLKWMYKNIIQTTLLNRFIILSLLIESFLLFNGRQPLFWIPILLCGSIKSKLLIQSKK